MDKSKSKNSASKTIVRISVSAMFLALALVVKVIGGFYIPIFGGNGMRVGFAGVFTFFPAILFGPVYGGAVSGLLDILGYIIKPDGAYVPFLTLTAILGGVLKGLIWRFIHSDKNVRSRIRAGVAVCFALIGAFGIFSHVSLIRDGIISGYIAKQSELPSRGMTESMSLSRQSEFILSLAQYNNDTITLTSATGSGNIILPDTAVIDGRSYKITKLGSGAFESAEDISVIYIPLSYTKFDDGAFDGIGEAQIICETGSSAVKTLTDLGYTVTEGTVEHTVEDIASDTIGVFKINSSDTWRKYLAGYINFITVGLELIAAAGLIFAVIDLIISKKKSTADISKPSVMSDSLKIFVTIFIAGLTVTTINTEILKWYLTAWNGRSFIILWVPRVIEEMLVCMVQAYIIAILYGIYQRRIAGNPRFRNITE